MAALAAFLCASALSVAPAVAAGTSTFTVTTTADAPLTGCDDGASGTSLREAVCLAAAARDAVVLVPSGERFALQHGPLVLDPGAAATIEVRATGSTRFEIDGGGAQIFDIDPSTVGHVDVTLSSMRLTHGAGVAPAAGGIGGGAVLAGSGIPGLPDSLTLSDCVVAGNRNVPAGSPGSARAPGGGVLMNGGTLTVRGCTFEDNTSDGAPGGAVAMIGVDAADRVVIEGSTFRSNAVTGADVGGGVLGGGAVWVSGARLSVSGSTFRANSVTSASAASVLGSAVYATGAADVTGTVVEHNTASSAGAGEPGALALGSGAVTASRLVGNTATSTSGPSRAAVRGPLAAGGSLAAPRSWWGCAGGPADARCDGTSGSVASTPYATFVGAVTPSAPQQGDATTLTVALTQSDGTAAAPELVALLAGATVTWSHAPAGGAVLPAGDSALAADGAAALRYTTGAGRSLVATATIDGSVVTTTIENSYAPEVALASTASATEGVPVMLSATVAARPAAAVQWQTAPAGSSTWTAVPGATAASLQITPTRADDGARYRLVATNTVASTTGPETTLGVSWGPLVSASPADVTVLAGATADFTVAVAGKPAPSVRWQSRTPTGTWTDIAGATSTTYRTAPLTAADSGTRFRAQVTGTGAAVSAEALLTVETVPVVTQQPSPVTPAEGAPLVLEAVFSGAPPVSGVVWEWRAVGTSAWVPVASPSTTVTTSTTGAVTTSRYEVTAARALSGDYRAVGTAPLVTGARSVTTSTAGVQVLWGPEIATQPADTTVAVGGAATFAVVVAGDPAPTVVWKDGTGAELGTGLTLTLPAVTLADGSRVFHAEVSARGATVASRDAVLTVTLAPTFTTGPADTTADAGSTTTFGVVVTGAPAPAVRWQQRSGPSGTWVDVVGTGPTLSLVPGPTDDGHQYRAVATSSAGTATSNPATLTVLTAPTLTDPADAAVTPGSTARFTVTATGSPTPAITWETSTDGVAWSAVAGAAGPTLGLVTTIADDGLLVRAVVSSTLVGGPSTAASAPATLTVLAAPVLVRGPGSVVGPDGAVRVAAGAPFTLSYVVEAAGASGQWEASRDGGATWSPFLTTRTARAMLAAAATPASYDLTYTPTAADAGLMLRLRVTNAVATATFGPVTVVLQSQAPGAGTVVTDPGSSTGGSPADGATAPTATSGAAATDATRLPTTGGEVTALLATALVMTVCGAVALLAHRRRAV